MGDVIDTWRCPERGIDAKSMTQRQRRYFENVFGHRTAEFGEETS
jgi:hypothetical protein